jgi:heat shock protein HslJ
MAPLPVRSFGFLFALGGLLGCHHGGAATGATPLGSELINFTWILRGLNGQPAGLGANGREATLRFGASGAASGFGGCNQFRATYKVDADSLRFQPAASTRMACSEGMSLEQDFLLALTKVRGWRLTGRHLELLSDAGTIADFDRR